APLCLPSGGSDSTESLKDRGLPPDAPDVAEGVAHLAHRHVGACGSHDRLHQVAVLMRRIFAQTRQRLLGRGGIAARAERLHPVDLLALERRIDLEDLKLALFVELVAVDADDDPLLPLDLRLVAERGFCDLALE